MGSDVEMIFSSSGANCSILVAMMTPCAHGALDPAVRSLVYDVVDSCQLFRSAPTLLSSMALEINDGLRCGLTPGAPSIVPTPPSLVRGAGQTSPRPPRLLDRVREANRLRHGSRSTEKSYVGWIRRFILFHGKRHPLRSRSSSARWPSRGGWPRQPRTRR